MLKMNFWNQLVGSMVKTEYYSTFVKESTSKAVLYVVLLVFIASLALGIKMSLMWNDTVNTVGTEIQAKSPDFIFTGGELAVKAPMPYVISDTKEFLVVVDTTGKTNEQVLNGHEKGLFIGKNKMVDKMSLVETRAYDLSKIKDLTFTKADVIKIIPWMKWFNIAAVIGIFLGGIIANSFAALLIAMCGWLASKIMSYKILFNELYKISLYAMTLPLFFEVAKDLLGVKIPLFGWAFYIITFGYVIRVLMRLKKESKMIVTVDEIV